MPLPARKTLRKVSSILSHMAVLIDFCSSEVPDHLKNIRPCRVFLLFFKRYGPMFNQFWRIRGHRKKRGDPGGGRPTRYAAKRAAHVTPCLVNLPALSPPLSPSLSAGEEETAYALILSLKIVSLNDIELWFDQQAPARYPHLLMSQAPSRCCILQARPPLVQHAGAYRRTLATDEESTTPLLDDDVDLCFGHRQLTAGTSLK